MPLSYRAEPLPNRLPHRMRASPSALRRRAAAGPGRHRPLAPCRSSSARTSAEVFRIGREIPTGSFWSGWPARSSTTARGSSATRSPRSCAATPATRPGSGSCTPGSRRPTSSTCTCTSGTRAADAAGRAAEPGDAARLAADRLDHHRPADGLHDRPALRVGQPAARPRRHDLALPPLPALPPRDVGAVAQLRPAGRRVARPFPDGTPVPTGWRPLPGRDPQDPATATRASPGSSTRSLPAEGAAAARAAMTRAQGRPPPPAADAAALSPTKAAAWVPSSARVRGRCSSTSTARPG